MKKLSKRDKDKLITKAIKQFIDNIPEVCEDIKVENYEDNLHGFELDLRSFRDCKMVNDKKYYSNCFIEAIKRKIKNPFKIRIYLVPASVSFFRCPHFFWSDGINDYDFSCEGDKPADELKWYNFLWWKGQVVSHSLGYANKYIKTLKKWNSHHQ